MRLRNLAVLAAPALALSLTTMPAHAAGSSQLAIAGPAAEDLNFLTQHITIKQGGSITFLNLDADMHSFTSTEQRTRLVKIGKRTVKVQSPYFDTGLINGPKSVKVANISTLKPGIYHFICTLHERMSGVLTVTKS